MRWLFTSIFNALNKTFQLAVAIPHSSLLRGCEKRTFLIFWKFSKLCYTFLPNTYTHIHTVIEFSKIFLVPKIWIWIPCSHKTKLNNYKVNNQSVLSQFKINLNLWRNVKQQQIYSNDTAKALMKALLSNLAFYL